ncbi:MAG: glycosyltransferase [Woeseiaceae bacterium]
MRTCIVIPYFDHFAEFREFLPKLTATGLTLLVVDDATPVDDGDLLAALLARDAPGAVLVRRERNGGKGAAVMTGLRAALQAGFTHAVQIDADGQHDTADLPTFLETSARHPHSLVCGEPQFGDDISRLRYYGRFVTLSFSWLETLSTEIRDALCGFRVYPLAQTISLLDNCKPGKRMAFDPEILVRAVWSGLELRFVPITVRYPQGGRSHFRYFGDNAEIAWMHTRLIFGMLLQLPTLVRRRRRATGKARA